MRTIKDKLNFAPEKETGKTTKLPKQKTVRNNFTKTRNLIKRRSSKKKEK